MEPPTPSAQIIDELDDILNWDNDWDLESSDRPLAPPPEGTYSFHTTAIEAVQNWAKAHQYATYIQRTNKDRSKNIEAVYLACELGDAYTPVGMTRKTATSKVGCTFNVRISLRKIDGLWHLVVREPAHNHEPTAISTHIQYRRDEMLQKLPLIDQLIDMKTPTRRIIAHLHRTDQATLIQAQDIKNYRYRAFKRHLAGRTPLQALIQDFKGNDNWVLSYDTKNHYLTRLFLMHKTSSQLLKQYPNILFMDCTYKTNRHGLSLLNIVGMTATNKTFYVGFGLLEDEKSDSYSYIMAHLRQIYIDLRINSTGPSTVVTDRDLSILRSLSEELSNADQILCWWHVFEAIKAYGRNRVMDKLREGLQSQYEFDEDATLKDKVNTIWTTMEEDLRTVLLQSSREEVDIEWLQFKAQYHEYPRFLAYMEKEWLQSHHSRRFLKCYTNNYTHFNQITTSRNEGAHISLKKDGTPMNNLLALVENIDDVCTTRHAAIPWDPERTTRSTNRP
jgi:hypothetical protein